MPTPLLLVLCLPQIRHYLTWDQSWAAAFWNQSSSTWTMAWLHCSVKVRSHLWRHYTQGGFFYMQHMTALHSFLFHKVTASLPLLSSGFHASNGRCSAPSRFPNCPCTSVTTAATALHTLQITIAYATSRLTHWLIETAASSLLSVRAL